MKKVFRNEFLKGKIGKKKAVDLLGLEREIIVIYNDINIIIYEDDFDDINIDFYDADCGEPLGGQFDFLGYAD